MVSGPIKILRLIIHSCTFAYACNYCGVLSSINQHSFLEFNMSNTTTKISVLVYILYFVLYSVAICGWNILRYFNYSVKYSSPQNSISSVDGALKVWT